MTGFVVILKQSGQRATASQRFCATLDEALGGALMDLDSAMRSGGFKSQYRLECPIMEEGVLNVTAISDVRDGYPKQLMIDAYIVSVNLGTYFDNDFKDKEARP